MIGPMIKMEVLLEKEVMKKIIINRY